MRTSSKRIALIGVVLIAAGALFELVIGCSNVIHTLEPNAVPALISFAPSFVVEGAASQTIAINGTRFVPSSSVLFNGSPRTATFVSSTQISLSLNQADLAVPGNYTIEVTNPPPGGGTSARATFSVWDALEDPTKGLKFAVPPFDAPSQITSSPDRAFVEFDLRNSAGLFIPEIYLTIYNNAQGLTLDQWFEYNVDVNGLLLSSGAYQPETLADGSSALVFVGPIPDQFFAVGGPPLDNVYRTSNSGNILSISQSQVNDLSVYGYSSTPSLIQLESEIQSTAHY